MNWDAIGAIGQATSALALLFVWIQLRHARQEMQRSISTQRAEAIRSSMQLVTQPSVLRAELKAHGALGGPSVPFVEALMKQAGASEEEAHILFFYYGLVWQTLEPTIRSRDQADPGDRAAMDMDLRVMYQVRPVSRLWFETMKITLNPNSVRYVERVLASNFLDSLRRDRP